MEIYYFQQVDRESGELLGYISYNGIRPTNDDERIELVEITEDAFVDATAIIVECDEEE